MGFLLGFPASWRAFCPKMKRVPQLELLDTDRGTAREIATSLVDLRHTNDWFGGVATTVSMLEHVARLEKRRQLSLLDVAAGDGYVPLRARDVLSKRGLDVRITLLDRARSHLTSAAGAVVGDASFLPFAVDSFDLVSCCLFAHHLAPDQLKSFVKEALRVCRKAVLINDLIRRRLHLMLVYAARPLFRSPITRHDAVASVRQAYTINEVREMLRDTPAARIEIRRHYLLRMGVIAWKT